MKSMCYKVDVLRRQVSRSDLKAPAVLAAFVRHALWGVFIHIVLLNSENALGERGSSYRSGNM